MGASGLKLDIETAESLERFTDDVKRKGGPAAGYNCHAGSVPRVTSDWLLDLAPLSFHLAMDQRDIGFGNFTRAKLIGEILVGGFGLGYYEQS